MTYDLMLLADPGTDRARVLEILSATPDLTPDAALEDRFWLKAADAEAQVNIGTKDPVESIHVTFELEELDRMEAVARRSLTLAERLDMRVEDVQWGYEVSADNLSGLREYWQSLQNRSTLVADQARKPWWKVW
jgi:hypothetical protein